MGANVRRCRNRRDAGVSARPRLRPAKPIKAFTLIELLVVVAIVSLLVSIVLPTLLTARELAKSASCMANMRSFGTALEFYASDWQDYLVPAFYGRTDCGDIAVDPVTETASWQTILVHEAYISAPKSKSEDVIPSEATPFLCPAGKRVVAKLPYPSHGKPTDATFASAFPHKSTYTGETYYIHSSYGINADTYYVERFPFAKVPQDVTGRVFLRRATDIARAGDVAGIYDGWHVHRGWGWYTISSRHMRKSKTNVLRMDGSTGTYARSLLPTQAFHRKTYVQTYMLSAGASTEDCGLLWRMDQMP
jgi:prepilin-type N-terminal cleavage/methylation domain-containing protein